MVRISYVQLLQVNSISTSSILIVGDARRLTPNSKAIAVQREIPSFLGNEGNFNIYPIFSKEIPEPKETNHVQMNIINESKFIKVRDLEITAVGASSIIQIGSSCSIESESRIKHIRQLLERRN